jgi:hypothetical protein
METKLFVQLLYGQYKKQTPSKCTKQLLNEVGGISYLFDTRSTTGEQQSDKTGPDRRE